MPAHASAVSTPPHPRRDILGFSPLSVRCLCVHMTPPRPPATWRCVRGGGVVSVCPPTQCRVSAPAPAMSNNRPSRPLSSLLVFDARPPPRLKERRVARFSRILTQRRKSGGLTLFFRNSGGLRRAHSSRTLSVGGGAADREASKSRSLSPRAAGWRGTRPSDRSGRRAGQSRAPAEATPSRRTPIGGRNLPCRGVAAWRAHQGPRGVFVCVRDAAFESRPAAPCRRSEAL